MIIRYFTAKQLQKTCEDLQCEDGEAYVAGWYYQTSSEDAPIGPYKTEQAAKRAAP